MNHEAARYEAALVVHGAFGLAEPHAALVDGIRRDYHLLARRVSEAFQDSLDAEERDRLRQSIHDMLQYLDHGSELFRDPPNEQTLQVFDDAPAARGRPRLNISENFLRASLEDRSQTSISKSLGCSARTVRRRMLDYAISEPALATFVSTIGADGSSRRIRNINAFGPSRGFFSRLLPTQLDRLVAEAIEVFPSSGRAMVQGYLRRAGYRVQKGRVRASILRVTMGTRRFRQRVAQRRTYRVAGPNSLWHHDGHHGGSVDNIRIERLWVDVVRGVVNKWHIFFQQLEQFDNLDVEERAHVWLLHHLFLDTINDELSLWAETWNRHPMSIARENRDISTSNSESPFSMYLYGMVQNGARGFDVQVPEDVPQDQLQDYGVDWAAQNDRRLRRSNRINNPNEEELNQGPAHPARFSRVDVVPPMGPEDPDIIVRLNDRLMRSPGYGSTTMQGYRIQWIDGLQCLQELTA
ncbi:hypothetical protein BKA62DRAFT_625900 [Auriculariales sp. MPI-PUGE-AT-0066]|nr:hypothetical protein BKA62DRAFT_625900 [Auriculariales sp. MPI-PUGE-AT-0066]